MKTALGLILSLVVLLLIGLFLLQPGDIPSASTRTAMRGPVGTGAPALYGGDPTVWVSEPVSPSLSPAVRDLPPWEPGLPTLDRELAGRDDHGFVGPGIQGEPWANPLVLVQANARATTVDRFDTPILNFAGVTSPASPPDATGDVGPNHFVQGDNGPDGGRVTIYNKSGVLQHQFHLQDLVPDGITPTPDCKNGYGDPIIQYDEQADRWLISEFDYSLHSLCVYISVSPDPTSTWYGYEFNPAGTNQDYPKYAVWPDGYYIGVNNGGYVHVLDRIAMLAGQPAVVQSFDIGTLPGFGFQLTVPATLEGDAPPAGEPAIFMRPVDTEIHDGYTCPSEPCDLMEIWELDVDWNTPANSTLTKLSDIQIAEYDHTLCGTGNDWACMPQPETTQKIDPIREPLHYPLQYRNFGTHETLVGCFAEDVDGTDHAAVHWFEIRRDGGNWYSYQEGVLGGEANVHRSVCSAAMDRMGNIAVGYTRTGDNAPYYPQSTTRDASRRTRWAPCPFTTA